jgi:hypothetical protein
MVVGIASKVPKGCWELRLPVALCLFPVRGPVTVLVEVVLLVVDWAEDNDCVHNSIDIQVRVRTGQAKAISRSAFRAASQSSLSCLSSC